MTFSICNGSCLKIISNDDLISALIVPFFSFPNPKLIISINGLISFLQALILGDCKFLGVVVLFDRLRETKKFKFFAKCCEIIALVKK